MILDVLGYGRMGRPMTEAFAQAGCDPRGFDCKPARDFENLVPQLWTCRNFAKVCEY